MNEKSKQNLENAMNDCFDRAEVCPADSEDYLKLLKQATEIARVLNEKEKNEMDYKIEQKKEDDQFNWKDPKFLIEIGKDLAAILLTFGLQRAMLREHRRETMAFEKDGVWTTQAGRANANIFRFGGNKGLL